MFYTEVFIEELKLRPCIWDPDCESFKDRDKKKMKWFELCSMFHPEFDKSSPRKREEICKSLQSKWRNIKDAYRKFWRAKRTKSGRARKPVPKYIFSAQLSFLDKVFEKGRAHVPSFFEVSSMEDDCQESQFLGTTDASPDFEVNSIEDNGQDSKFLFAEGENETEKEVEKQSYTGMTSENLRRKQRTEDKIGNDNESFQAPKIPRLEQENDDMAFFRSLIPVMNTLPLQEKLKFRMEVLKIAIEYSGKIHSQDKNHPHQQ